MEREQIIKALECCIKVCKHRDVKFCRICPLRKEKCILELPKKSLALIKELTAKTEAQDIVIAKLCKKLGKAEHDADRYANRIKELNAEVSVKKKLLIKSSDLVERIQSDTVRKMQERLKNKIEHSTYNANTERKTVRKEELLEQVNWVYKEVVPNLIDQIAKEMLEENENGQREND